MFDCHAHLTDSSLIDELDEHLVGAEAAGVTGIVSVSESLEDANQVLALCRRINSDPRRRLRLHASLGMHPVKADLESLGGMIELIDANAQSIVCVGEVGLDYSRHVIGEKGDSYERAKEVQQEVFARQARRAEELGLAVNVHSRSAGHHAITLLRDAGISRAVLHAFDGKPKYALEAARAGYFFSVPPIVCRSEGFQKLVKAVPLESLLLETDSPALADLIEVMYFSIHPDKRRVDKSAQAPVKNGVNEPKNITVSCEWIASLKNVPIPAVAESTTRNARRLFPRAFL